MPQSISLHVLHVDSINALHVSCGGFDADVEGADDVDEIAGIFHGLAGRDGGLDEMLDLRGAVETAVGNGIDEGEDADWPSAT